MPKSILGAKDLVLAVLLRIPNLKELNLSDRKRLIDSYDNRDFEVMNKIVNKYCFRHRIKVIGDNVSPEGYCVDDQKKCFFEGAELFCRFVG